MPLARMERYLQTGAFHQVRKEAERLLQGGSLPRGVEAHVLWMACHAARSLQEYYAACRLGEEALDRARQVDDRLTQGRVHFELGSALVAIGDGYGAEANLSAFLALASAFSELERWEGEAYRALATVHQQRRQWDLSLQALERASLLAACRGDRSHGAQIALEAAWCCLMRGAPDLASPYLAQAEGYLATHTAPHLSADLICRKALYHRQVKEIARSSRLCQELFTPDRPGVTDRHLCEAAWIMGENALEVGQIEEAARFASQALEYATRGNWPAILNQIGRLRRTVAGRLGAWA